MTPMNEVQVSQVAHPWRATVRTVFQALVALCVLAPAVFEAAGLDGLAWSAGVLAVTGAVTRVMALPGVNAFLATYLPWLAPTPSDIS